MTTPRVSLIVRSVGRDELRDALASAEAQTHLPLEIVVVDATGGTHPAVPEQVGKHQVVFVPGTARRIRPVAANAGLDTARGDLIGFLDDDDELLPDHVAGLVAALASDPECALAFSAARESWPGGEVRHIGNPRVTRLTLHEANAFPPCAALFRRELLAHCRFDESLAACEDWDFWLQVARHTRFRFVPGETAIYRADRGRSAMTSDGDAAERWHNAVRSKWTSERETLIAEVERLFDRALASMADNDAVGAAAMAARTLDAYPYHVGALNLRGTLAAMRGAFDVAARDFEAACEAAPDDPASLVNLAQAHDRRGLASEAKACWRRLLALDPNHPLARAGLTRAPTPGSPT